MQRYNLLICFFVFVVIWSIWSVWTAYQPLLTTDQLSFLFLCLPVSALLLAFSFFDDEDDDDFGGGIMQPVLQRNKT